MTVRTQTLGRPAWLLVCLLPAFACEGERARPPGPSPTEVASHGRMLAALAEVRARTPETNEWLGDRQARRLRPRVAAVADAGVTAAQWFEIFQLGVAELWLGNEREAIRHLERARRLVGHVEVEPRWRDIVTFRLGVAWLRLGETENCCQRNTPDSCILPIRGGGVHEDQAGARGAIAAFTSVLETAEPESDLSRGAQWLLNIASMTIGQYPGGVPERYRIPPSAFASEESFPRFRNVAREAGLAAFSLSGGVVADDFDNDGHLDLLVTTWDTSGPMRCYRSDGRGRFVERTREAGLEGLLGGLNMVQGDYDNDGRVDVFVMRGAWLGRNGRHPNSLLRNLDEGRFVDVTFKAGLAEPSYPTQTAAWADYDNDGDLDLYVGNEADAGLAAPCQLFRNNGDGTFTDVARAAGVTNDRYAKAVLWGDYDADRWPDLFVSNLEGENRLYRNRGDGTFRDVAPELGLTGPRRSFPAWFWDYDNDGHLDLYVAAYAADIWHLADAYLGRDPGVEMARLWHGDGHGHFTDAARACHLVRPNSPMGSNFGDLDNDGYLDFYLGTGFPSYDTVMPNVMMHNRGGTSFGDVSVAGGFSHLQKGHAVAFADLDEDGDQDVFEEMGGALRGDGFFDALYENPGFGNHWLAVRVAGRTSNRSGIGARLHVVVAEEGQRRDVYRHVNSGGSFGANPLRQTIGLGRADQIELLEVYWPTTGLTQRFTEVPRDCFVRVTEGEDVLETRAPPQ